MIYAGNLLTVNGIAIPELKTYKVTRNKLWKDADRNMNGDIRATLIGIFPKIELEIGTVTEDRMKTLTILFDQAYFSVTYFDHRIQATRTANFYANDYSVELLSKVRGLYKPFDVNLIPVSKM